MKTNKNFRESRAHFARQASCGGCSPVQTAWTFSSARDLKAAVVTTAIRGRGHRGAETSAAKTCNSVCELMQRLSLEIFFSRCHAGSARQPVWWTNLKPRKNGLLCARKNEPQLLLLSFHIISSIMDQRHHPVLAAAAGGGPGCSRSVSAPPSSAPLAGSVGGTSKCSLGENGIDSSRGCKDAAALKPAGSDDLSEKQQLVEAHARTSSLSLKK